MKVALRRLALSIALTAGLVIPSAAWADGRPRQKAADRAPNWTGCYLAGFVGGAWGGNVSATEAQSGGTFYNDPGASFDYGLGGSVTFGAAVGCNYHVPKSKLVVGLEGELGTFHLRGSSVDPNSIAKAASDVHVSTRLSDRYGIVAGRVGLPIQNSLLYLKAGVAWLNMNSTIVDTCNTAPCGPALLNASGGLRDTTWVIGAGLEYALASNWSLRAEYLRFGPFDDYQVCGPVVLGGVNVAQVCSRHELDPIHVVRLGVSYKLGQ